ncbi:MAG: caspase family protein [Spirochaetia bacterium]|nr:caspase family protein [Spirochaetia bacterium]
MLTKCPLPKTIIRKLLTYSVLLGAIILVLAVTSCKLNPTPPDRYALVYGVSIYNSNFPEYSEHPENPNLVWTDNDAVDLAKMLYEKGYEVRLRINDGSSTDLLTSSEESLFSLKPANKTTFFDEDMPYYQNPANIAKGDIVLFYFSGHGTNSYEFSQEETGEEDSLSNSADEFLVLPSYPSDYYLLSDNIVSSNFNKISAIKKVIILDSCFSGGFIGQSYDADRIKDDYSSDDPYKDNIFSLALNSFFYNGTEDITPNNAIVLSASGENENSLEPAYDDTTFENGFFTEGLLYSAELGDYNNDGYISALEIYRYSKAFLSNLFNNFDFISFYEYSPHISGGPVDYILFKAD